MSEPNVTEGRFLIISVEDTPLSGTYRVFCGIISTGFNRTVTTADRFIRDCANLTEVPTRRVVVQGKQADLTGNGYYNLDEEAQNNALIGQIRKYRYTLYERDGATTPGYFDLSGVLTSFNVGGDENDLSTLELTIANDGPWTFTPTP